MHPLARVGWNGAQARMARVELANGRGTSPSGGSEARNRLNTDDCLTS
jgi:hypothetical protein